LLCILKTAIVIDWTNTYSLMARVFQLLKVGHITPIEPVASFNFENIRDAFSHVRDAGHFGKTVVTRGSGDSPSMVTVQQASPPELRLRPDASYLIVGGLRGIGGSLAIFLAKHGAKMLIVLCRSGCKDPLSLAVIASCGSLGCDIEEVLGDVTSREDVQRTFDSSTRPIRGVIQGAAVYVVCGKLHS
jgi:hypothetical protein